MRQHVFHARLSRRQVLQIGAAAGLVAMFGRLPSAYAADDQAHLRRSTYDGLVGQPFSVDGETLTLMSATGDEDAFSLQFSGRAGALETGIHSVSHPTLGTFDLFVSPVSVEQAGRYEVVVNTSVDLPRDPPAAPAAAAAAPAVAALPAARTGAVKRKAPPKKKAKKKKPVKHKRRILKRRKRHHAKTAS